MRSGCLMLHNRNSRTFPHPGRPIFRYLQLSESGGRPRQGCPSWIFLRLGGGVGRVAVSAKVSKSYCDTGSMARRLRLQLWKCSALEAVISFQEGFGHSGEACNA